MGIVQASCLGHLGRFGNQLFQYAAARGYARKIGATLETPSWVGQTLFKDINDPPLSRQVEILPIEAIPDDGRDNVGFIGYFHSKAAYDLYTLADLRSWFQLSDWVKAEMFEYGPVPLAAHLRRGDYVTTYAASFCTVGESAYYRAMSDNGFGDLPVTWVREDMPREFKRPGLEWLIDFWVLLNAEVLFRANSTFSWWAGTLGNHKRVYSPLIDGLRGLHNDVKFIEGNWPRTADHPGVHDYHIK